MTRSLRLALLPTVLVLLASCSKSDAPSVGATSPHLLKADVADAVPVLAAVKKDPGTDVAVFGRVRYLAKGTFTLVDDSLDYCGRGSSKDNCPMPWDYCCEDQEVVAAASVVVDALTAGGAPVAKQDLGLRPLDLVAVRGKLRKNDQGEPVLVATSGWFRRERPVVPDNVKFE